MEIDNFELPKMSYKEKWYVKTNPPSQPEPPSLPNLQNIVSISGNHSSNNIPTTNKHSTTYTSTSFSTNIILSTGERLHVLVQQPTDYNPSLMEWDLIGLNLNLSFQVNNALL